APAANPPNSHAPARATASSNVTEIGTSTADSRTTPATAETNSQSPRSKRPYRQSLAHSHPNAADAAMTIRSNQGDPTQIAPIATGARTAADAILVQKFRAPPSGARGA